MTEQTQANAELEFYTKSLKSENVVKLTLYHKVRLPQLLA
jgi:hypothetical protein